MSGSTDGYPSVPHDRLLADGWELRSKLEETVFRLPTTTVLGHTLVYVDAGLRESIEATGVDDQPVGSGGDGRLVEIGSGKDVPRFFFATALSFRPPLPPGIGPASIRPIVTSQARRAFASDLRARGFKAPESAERRRIRTESGERATLRRFTARSSSESDDFPEQLEIEGYLAVWVKNGSFRISGGAYPIDGVDAHLGSTFERATTREEFHEELIGLIRRVE